MKKTFFFSLMTAVSLALFSCGGDGNTPDSPSGKEGGKQDEPEEKVDPAPTTLPKAVDLGLSVDWAPFNVGATEVGDYGKYYAWGELSAKEDYTWATYKWCNGTDNSLTKYCSYESLGKDGFTDGLSVLGSADDVAAQSWKNGWRYPTIAEWEELITHCTIRTGKVGRKSGYWFVSNVPGHTADSIFIPKAGQRLGKMLYSEGGEIYYWASDLKVSSKCNKATYIDEDFLKDTHNWKSFYVKERCEGYSVRPVKGKK